MKKVIISFITTITLISLLVACETIEKNHSEKGQNGSDLGYTCPMHAEVASSNYGICPKCGMKLVPKSSVTTEKR